MKRSRIVLLTVSSALVLVGVGGGRLAWVAAADGTYRQVILFAEVLSLVTDNYVDPVDSDSLLLGAFEGTMDGLDAHGAYLTPAAVTEWKKPQPARQADPGISVLKAYGALQVIAVAKGSPAEAAGIDPGDQVRRIDGHSLRDLSLDQSLRLLRGEPGTTVKLGVFHPKEGFRREDLTVKRAPRADSPYRLDVEQGIAVLTVHDLARASGPELARELADVRGRGVERLLLDLRDLADQGPREAVGLLDLFASGSLLELRDRSGQKLETLESRGGSRAWSGPIAVLVNGGTAGGSEAVAKVLQSSKVATVYGESTYGLGAEPKLFELPDGSGLLLSAYVWQTAGGQGWNGDGIAPDHVVHGTGKPEEIEADQLRRTLEEFSAVRSDEPARKAA